MEYALEKLKRVQTLFSPLVVVKVAPFKIKQF
jgi:hypothetical protein